MKLPRIKRRERRKRGPDPNILVPPEGVPLVLPVAGLGVRWTAQIADILITGAALAAIMILLLWSQIVAPQTLMAIGALLFFLIRVPYYVLSELTWNGQTLGKRFMRIKVVSNDGGPLTTHALVLRNMMKEAEVFLPATLLLTLNAATPVASFLGLGWIAITLMVPLMNPRRRRLGDLMAGTYVIHLPVPTLLKDLAVEGGSPGQADRDFTFRAHQLDHYGAYELQTLEQLLRAGERVRGEAAYIRHAETLDAVIDKIRRKIAYPDPVPIAHQTAFLRAFYNAQRAHLEQKQLFGDRRADKFHSTLEGTDSTP